ncbi:MAG: YwaF family protein [Erysipelotrichaceae bacterium]|nr:YwaF family protein [Erysipelotrichaceae bacterium]
MKHFWTHKETMPEGMGYGQFRSGHFIWLAITAAMVIGTAVLYGRCVPAEKTFLLRSIGITLLVIEVIKMVLIGFSEVKLTDYLPLEICSFAAYFIVCDSFWTGNTVFPGMLLTLFLPAAIMAVLVPTTSTLPAFNFYTIHQFVYHGLIIAYVLTRFVYGEIPLTYAGVWRSIFNVILLAAVIYVIDVVFNKNFMFLRETYGNPLLEAIWNKTNGGFAYTIGLVCFCIVMIHIFFIFFKIISLLFL